MLTLAFAQIVWAICFKWNEVTGGEQGMPDMPYPELRLARLRSPGSATCGSTDKFYYPDADPGGPVVVAMRRIVALAVRPHAHHDPREPRAGPVHRRQRARATSWPSSSIAGGFAGLAGGAVRHLQPRRLPRLRLLAEVGRGADHDHPGRHRHISGARRSAPRCSSCSTSRSSSYTEYWPFVLGIILLVLLFVFPGGLVGALAAG